MAERLVSISELPVADIELGDRLRPVSEAGVEVLMASIRDLEVMKDPIQVRKVPHQGGRLVLMAGAHRLEVAKRLGWETIPAACWKCSDDWARLMEIDDNAAQADLTALDTAIFLAERKVVYEKIHPETKAGAAGAAARWNATDIVSFASVTAQKFGLSERHIQRLTKAGEALDADARKLLQSAPAPVTLKDLTVIAKIGEPEERSFVVKALAAGEAKGAGDARKSYGDMINPSDGPKRSREDVLFGRLTDAWNRAPKVVRDRFLEEQELERSS